MNYDQPLMHYEEALERVLHSTLTAFGHHILHTPWYGKEREAVSWYAFGFLAKACVQGGVLHDPGQLAIEGRIPGTRGHSKKQVCKDLVVWPEPGRNCWEGPENAVHVPLAVLEWKADRDTFHPDDLRKLQEYTAAYPELLGVAVTFNAKRKRLLRAAKVWRGAVEEGWLEVR